MTFKYPVMSPNKIVLPWFVSAIFLVLGGLYTALNAQQAAQYSLYHFTKFNFNPAYAGMEGSLVFNGVYRAQWTGIDGAPTSQYLDVHLPLQFLRSGFGIQFENDAVGAQQDMRFNLAYNYQIDVGAGVLALGVGGGIIQRRLDGSRLITPDGNYGENQTPDHQDPILPNTRATALAPSFQAGVFFKGNWLEAGFGVRNLLEQEVEFDNFTLLMDRTFFFQAEGRINVGRNWLFLPMMLVRANSTQLQSDIGVLIEYNENFFLGTTLRGYNSNSLDAVGIMGGLNISPNFRLAYNYDITMSSLNRVSNGSHEILLQFNLNKPIGEGRPPKIIFNPRTL